MAQVAESLGASREASPASRQLQFNEAEEHAYVSYGKCIDVLY